MAETKVNGMKVDSRLPAKPEDLSDVPEYQVTMYQSDITEKVVKQYFAPPDATREDIVIFMGLAKAQNLNPWLNEIFMIPFFGREGRRYATVVAYQVLLDRADSSGVMDGLEIECIPDDANPERCTVTVWRKDWSRPFKRTTLMSEVMRYKKDGTTPMALWMTRPRTMLEKCAVSAALRMGIPACRRLYIEEEFYARSDEVAVSEQAMLTEASVESAQKLDLTTLHGIYMGKITALMDEDQRHKFQKEKIGKESTKTWAEEDYVRGIELADEILATESKEEAESESTEQADDTKVNGKQLKAFAEQVADTVGYATEAVLEYCNESYDTHAKAILELKVALDNEPKMEELSEAIGNWIDGRTESAEPINEEGLEDATEIPIDNDEVQGDLLGGGKK